MVPTSFLIDILRPRPRCDILTVLIIIFFQSPLKCVIEGLTQWGQDKTAVISQTTISYAWFFHENIWISIDISLTFFPKGRINNTPALVQIMAWCRPGDNRPQWDYWQLRRRWIVTYAIGLGIPEYRGFSTRMVIKISYFLKQCQPALSTK